MGKNIKAGTKPHYGAKSGLYEISLMGFRGNSKEKEKKKKT